MESMLSVSRSYNDSTDKCTNKLDSRLKSVNFVGYISKATEHQQHYMSAIHLMSPCSDTKANWINGLRQHSINYSKHQSHHKQ